MVDALRGELPQAMENAADYVFRRALRFDYLVQSSDHCVVMEPSMKLTLLRRAIFVAGALTSMHAMAQSVASPARAEASVTGLGYRLIDLAPDDGQAPWLDLAGRWGSVSAAIQQSSGGELRGSLDQHG